MKFQRKKTLESGCDIHCDLLCGTMRATGCMTEKLRLSLGALVCDYHDTSPSAQRNLVSMTIVLEGRRCAHDGVARVG
jgi:hypothetical protein